MEAAMTTTQQPERRETCEWVWSGLYAPGAALMMNTSCGRFTPVTRFPKECQFCGGRIVTKENKP